jgi:hypothetical protein
MAAGSDATSSGPTLAQGVHLLKNTFQARVGRIDLVETRIRVDGSHQFAEIIKGVKFKDGEKLIERAA